MRILADTSRLVRTLAQLRHQELCFQMDDNQNTSLVFAGSTERVHSRHDCVSQAWRRKVNDDPECQEDTKRLKT